jgi:hypothetical protein
MGKDFYQVLGVRCVRASVCLSVCLSIHLSFESIATPSLPTRMLFASPLGI